MTTRLAVLVFVIAGIVAGAMPLGAGASSGVSPLAGHLLTKTELPSGWYPTTKPTTADFNGSCLQQARMAIKGKTWARARFSQNTAAILELVTDAAGSSHWKAVRSNLATCRNFTVKSLNRTFPASTSAVQFPRVGTSSSAYKVAVVGSTILTLTRYAVFFQVHTYFGLFLYSTFSKVNAQTVAALANAAAAKVEGQPVPAPTTSAPAASG
jgi:hypothetical protein